MPKRRGLNQQVHLALGGLIDEALRTGEAGWPAVSILYRVATEGHVVRSSKPGHKILCDELSRTARWIQPHFNALSLPERVIVITKHRPPPEGYKRWIDADRAHYLGEANGPAFSAKYQRILNKIKNRLT